MSDICTRLRAEIAWEADVGELLAEAADHIDSLRQEVRTQRLEIAGLREERRALLDSDRPMVDDPRAMDSPPPEPAIPPEWLQKPYYVDPPSGWRYGFPKLYDPLADGNMTEWMIANGYPEKLARQGLPCTFTAAERADPASAPHAPRK
jgi:hypothetical protein